MPNSHLGSRCPSRDTDQPDASAPLHHRRRRGQVRLVYLWVRFVSLSLGIAALSTGCRSTAPTLNVLLITGPSTGVAQGIVVADDTVDRVGCTAAVTALLTKAEDSLALDSARVSYSSVDGSSLASLTLGRDTLLTLGFAATVDSGVSNAAGIVFYATAPFSVQMSFYYTTINTRQHGVAPYSLQCVPAGPLLAGKYVLQTMNGLPLPQGNFLWTEVYFDTLQFFPPNMAYVQIDKYENGGTYTVRGGFDPYTIVDSTHYTLPYVTKGDGSGAAVLQGSTLTVVANDGVTAGSTTTYIFSLVPGSVSSASARRSPPVILGAGLRRARGASIR